MSSDLEHQIQKKIQALPEDQQRQVLDMIEDLLQEAEQPQPVNAQPIWEIFEALSRQVPIEEWSKLPSNGAEQHDQYLYGSPRSKSERSYSFIGIGHSGPHKGSTRTGTGRRDANGSEEE